MLLNLPYGATLVCVNEWLKQLLQKPHHVDSATESGSGLPLYFFCAGIFFVCSFLISYRVLRGLHHFSSSAPCVSGPLFI